MKTRRTITLGAISAPLMTRSLLISVPVESVTAHFANNDKRAEPPRALEAPLSSRDSGPLILCR
jgi:hypothetical protein